MARPERESASGPRGGATAGQRRAAAATTSPTSFSRGKETTEPIGRHRGHHGHASSRPLPQSHDHGATATATDTGRSSHASSRPGLQNHDYGGTPISGKDTTVAPHRDHTHKATTVELWPSMDPWPWSRSRPRPRSRSPPRTGHGHGHGRRTDHRQGHHGRASSRPKSTEPRPRSHKNSEATTATTAMATELVTAMDTTAMPCQSHGH